MQSIRFDLYAIDSCPVGSMIFRTGVLDSFVYHVLPCMCYMILLLQQFTAFCQPKSRLKMPFCKLAYQKLPLKKKERIQSSSILNNFKFCWDLLFIVSFPSVYKHISVIFLDFTSTFCLSVLPLRVLANTGRRKLPMLCLVSLFLFKFLAKVPRVFLSALLCFNLIRSGATGEGKLKKRMYQNLCRFF